MKPEFYRVHGVLQDYVSHIMIVDVELKGEGYSNYNPFPPTPQNNINFYPGDAMRTRKAGQNFSQSPDAIIIGPQTTRVDLSMGKHHIIVSVALHPGGMFRLLKVPMYQIMDEPLNAADLLGKDINEVNEKLKEAKSHMEMKTIVENYLLVKFAQHALSPFDRAMRAMLHNPDYSNIDTAAAASCLSIRQFQRRSKEVMGYSPKFFARLIRFSKAYRLKVNEPYLSWNKIAYSCGYFDQMHLIKDFKEFAGTTPGLITQEITSSSLQVQKDVRF